MIGRLLCAVWEAGDWRERVTGGRPLQPTMMTCPKCKASGLIGPRKALWSLFVWFRPPKGQFTDAYQCKECHLIFAPERVVDT